MEKIKLNRVYSLKEVVELYGDFTVCNKFTMILPTEVVMTEYKMPILNHAYCYSLGLWYVEEKFYDSSELRLLPNFKGTYNYDKVGLLEVFIDEGSDGHCAFSQRGYTFVLLKDIIEDFLQNNKYPEQLIENIYWEKSK